MNQSNQIASIHCCAFSLSVRLQSFSLNMDTIDVKNVLLALFIEHEGNLKTSKSQQLNAIVVCRRQSWYAAGYVAEKPAPFFTPVQYCFDNSLSTEGCSLENCSNLCFLRCAWCKKLLCFSHLTDDASFHFCENFVE